jgi:hypothetical protein
MADDAASMTRAERRLAQLDREWDVDRALMAALGTVGTFVAVRAALGVRATGGLNGWLYAVRVPFAFLLMQAVAGWSPPVAVLRRLGFRTRMEIDAERSALRELAQQPRSTIAPSTDVWPASDA